MRQILLVPLVSVLFIGQVSGLGSSSEKEQEILELTRKLLENIYVHPSASFYEEFVDPDVTAYEGLPTRKDGIGYHLVALRSMESAPSMGFKNHLELLNPKVQLFGGFAVVTCTSEVTSFGDGEVHTELLNETRVWVREEGKWKLVHFHKSPVRWPAEAP